MPASATPGTPELLVSTGLHVLGSDLTSRVAREHKSELARYVRRLPEGFGFLAFTEWCKVSTGRQGSKDQAALTWSSVSVGDKGGGDAITFGLGEQ